MVFHNIHLLRIKNYISYYNYKYDKNNQLLQRTSKIVIFRNGDSHDCSWFSFVRLQSKQHQKRNHQTE